MPTTKRWNKIKASTTSQALLQCRFRLDAVRNVPRDRLCVNHKNSWADLFWCGLFFCTKIPDVHCLFPLCIFISLLCVKQYHRVLSRVNIFQVSSHLRFLSCHFPRGDGQTRNVSCDYSDSSWHLFMCRVKEEKNNLSCTVITVSQVETLWIIHHQPTANSIQGILPNYSHSTRTKIRLHI